MRTNTEKHKLTFIVTYINISSIYVGVCICMYVHEIISQYQMQSNVLVTKTYAIPACKTLVDTHRYTQVKIRLVILTHL